MYSVLSAPYALVRPGAIVPWNAVSPSASTVTVVAARVRTLAVIAPSVSGVAVGLSVSVGSGAGVSVGGSVSVGSGVRVLVGRGVLVGSAAGVGTRAIPSTPPPEGDSPVPPDRAWIGGRVGVLVTRGRGRFFFLAGLGVGFAARVAVGVGSARAAFRVLVAAGRRACVGTCATATALGVVTALAPSVASGAAGIRNARYARASVATPSTAIVEASPKSGAQCRLVLGARLPPDRDTCAWPDPRVA